jgi:hypothetical protein
VKLLNFIKSKKKLFIITVLLISVFTAIVNAETFVPGSVDDPVVTKSYVDTKLIELENKLSGAQGGSSSYQPVQVLQGKTLLGGVGTEIIFRSGEATAIDNGQNGISDITTGKDLRTGEALTLNHLLVIPKEDGRGIKATTDIWIMIKGKYTVI